MFRLAILTAVFIGVTPGPYLRFAPESVRVVKEIRHPVSSIRVVLCAKPTRPDIIEEEVCDIR